MTKIAFLINSTIKRMDKIRQRIAAAFENKLPFEILASEYAGHTSILAKEAIGNGFTHLITVGGDGSINETLNGLMAGFELTDTAQTSLHTQYDFEGLSKIRMGVLPMGSGNDFARSINMQADPSLLLRLIQADNPQRVDIGWVGFQGPDGNSSQRFFQNITDTGMGGTVALKLKQSSKWMGPNLTYMKSIIATFLSYRNAPVRCYHGDFSWEGKVNSVILANGRFFGSGMGIAPKAELDSGEFSLVILGDISLIDYLKKLGKVKRSLLIDHPEVHYFSTDQLTVEAINDPLPIDMDGEFIGYTPMQVKILHQRLPFLVNK